MIRGACTVEVCWVPVHKLINLLNLNIILCPIYQLLLILFILCQSKLQGKAWPSTGCRVEIVAVFVSHWSQRSISYREFSTADGAYTKYTSFETWTWRMMDVYEELRGYSDQPGRRQMRPHEDSSEKQRKQQQKHQEQGGQKKPKTWCTSRRLVKGGRNLYTHWKNRKSSNLLGF